MRARLTVAILLLAAHAVVAQPRKFTTNAGTTVEFPPLTVTGTTLTATVTYDAARQVYRYQYQVNAPISNAAAVQGVQIDISGRIARPQIDPALAENITRTKQLQPTTTIPVGITVPDPAFWRGGVGQGARAFFTAARDGGSILPGSTTGGFVIESKFPPGPRTAEIRPSIDPWYAIWETVPAGQEFENPPDQRQYFVTTTTIAPSDPDPATLFNGGGQSNAEVNPFLRYVTPTETRTHLPAGTTSVWVVVVYGLTTDPATFTATFNGVDVRPRFTPVPGATQAVKFDVPPGTSKLQLSIQGKKSSGASARDSDTLTFLVD